MLDTNSCDFLNNANHNSQIKSNLTTRVASYYFSIMLKFNHENEKENHTY